VNLHAGPIYFIHFKYSYIMTITFVTFMYGIELPILFPIALLSFFILYTVERLTLTYYYRKPPMYDEKMNKAAIGTLKWAPVFMLCFGYWGLTNKQIFSNVALPKLYASDPIVTDHHSVDIFDIN
jgi:hypothetical protein